MPGSSGSPRAASRGGPRPPTAGHSAWPRISWRSCSRPATRREPARRPTGGRWGRRLDPALTGPCRIAAGLLHWGPDATPRRPRGNGRRSLPSVSRWLRDAKRAGARRSGQRPTGGSPPPRRAIARREGRRAGPRGLRVVRLRDRPGGRQEHLDPPAPPAVLRDAHGEDRSRGRAEDRDAQAAAPPDAVAETEPAAGEGTRDVSDAAAASKGHGRNGAEAYRGAERIDVPHPSLVRATPVPRVARAPSTRRPRACWCGSPAGRRWRRRSTTCRSCVPPVRPGLHRGRARRGGRGSTTPRPGA